MDYLGPVSRKHQRLVWWEWQRNQGLIEEKRQKHKSHTSVTPAQYLVWLLVQTYLGQSRLGSETCKTPGWPSKGWWNLVLSRQKGRSSLIHLRQYIVPSAQEPPHSLMQTELVFWLTMKLSRNDRRNPLMVSFIGHYLSMMKLSTDYHRWNVFRWLMSSNPSLKQWKQ